MGMEELLLGLKTMRDGGRLRPTFDDVTKGLESYIVQPGNADPLWYIEDACRKRMEDVARYGWARREDGRMVEQPLFPKQNLKKKHATLVAKARPDRNAVLDAAESKNALHGPERFQARPADFQLKPPRLMIP